MSRTLLSIGFAFVLVMAGAAELPGDWMDPVQYKILSHAELVQALQRPAKDRLDSQQRVVTALAARTISKSSKIAAIYLAGLYRMPDAASVLSQMIDFYDDDADRDMHTLSESGSYPAALALSLIGAPSINEMIRNLAVDRSELVRKLSAGVLRDVLGDSLAQAALDDAIKHGPWSPAEKDRLKLAIPLLAPGVGAPTTIASQHRPPP